MDREAPRFRMTELCPMALRLLMRDLGGRLLRSGECSVAGGEDRARGISRCVSGRGWGCDWPELSEAKMTNPCAPLAVRLSSNEKQSILLDPESNSRRLSLLAPIPRSDRAPDHRSISSRLSLGEWVFGNPVSLIVTLVSR